NAVLVAEGEQAVGALEMFRARLRRDGADLQRDVGGNQPGLRDIEIAIERIAVDRRGRGRAEQETVPCTDLAKACRWRHRCRSAASAAYGKTGGGHLQEIAARERGHLTRAP